MVLKLEVVGREGVFELVGIGDEHLNLAVGPVEAGQVLQPQHQPLEVLLLQ